jgi:UDP-galactopyranose mutase
MKKAYVVGGGITGCSVASFLKSDFDVVLFEKEKVLGGLSRTQYNLENIPYQKGAHVLHTNDQWVLDLFKTACEMAPTEYSVAINPLFDFRYYSYPFTKQAIDMMPWHWKEAIKLDMEKVDGKHADNMQDFLVNYYGRTIFDVFYVNLFKKWFGIEANEITVVDWFRKQMRDVDNSSLNHSQFYKEKIVAFPVNKGYNALFESLTSGIDVRFGTEVSINNIPSDGVIVCTSRPDQFTLEQKTLEYVGVTFDIDSTEYAENKPDSVLFPNHTPFISMTQFGRYFPSFQKNIVVKEYPNGQEPAYPVPTKRNYRIVENIRKKFPKIHFIGRQGSFDFLDMADCVKQAAACAAEIKKEG